MLTRGRDFSHDLKMAGIISHSFALAGSMAGSCRSSALEIGPFYGIIGNYFITFVSLSASVDAPAILTKYSP